ncbi:MAG: ketoacyl-ACP synthase III [Bacteroidetes bacterium CG02_land_8_20_14_3_00_31_25]|nr:MAG: ketoacyl-ACP synthase III [Bacteroidetes bacterium CG02_land_8_20_14_3_00_31_25]PIX35155.1 MAG: ketoacyl-ACP synthase III [Bacteroidetes bacterium CG_4_8_14_3_um_filter_31_14]PIY04715.1 MAG: ketoacyl-ACP synthase III [Bacteroidetes bacterium CG_4_10_14_3_um_filter_31_20]
MYMISSECGIGILSVKHYLPSKILTNEELCKNIEGLTQEWIIEKTGIKRRYYISDTETASSMAIDVSRRLIEENKINPKEIGLIIIASFSQDYLFPPLSAKIHSAIGASKDCQIIDINTNCVGLVTATTIAAEKMKLNDKIKYSLIIGVEVLSAFTNLKDKDTAIFFSDGASGILLGKVKSGYGYINSKFTTDSSTYESVRMRGGGSMYPPNKLLNNLAVNNIEQNGLATWKQAITNLPPVIKELIKDNDLEMEDIDFFIFHQANSFLINYILGKLKIPREKTYTNVEEIGNTGSASIGIALSEAYSKGLIKSNSTILIAGVGAGFNFGANLWKIL